MSYDFHLVQRSTSNDPLAEARSLLEQDNEDINPGPPSPEKEERKAKLAKLLIESNPNLTPFEFGFADIAKKYGWTEEEARVKFRHIELNGPEDSNGIQITLYDNKADITVPYWHQPEAAANVFEEIWRYLAILIENGGFAVYDPQLDRILNLSMDRDDVLQKYGGVLSRMPSIIETSEHQKQPWWKFW
jgi:hypothetical protein